MRYTTLIILIFIASQTIGQSAWEIRDNIKSDNSHKKFPSYIEIDSTITKEDLSKVRVHYNSEFIIREGYRFYLPTKPFSDLTKPYNINVYLPESYWKSKPKRQIKQMKISTTDFNKIHSLDYYKIDAKNDSIYLGSDYVAEIVIDSNKIKDLSKIQVLFFNNPVQRNKNRFKISFKLIMEGAFNYDITIINNEKNPTDTIKLTHSAYGLMPLNKSLDYTVNPEKMPKFNSIEYKTFDDYFTRSTQIEKIEISGKLIISYTVMKDGSTRFEGVKRGNVNEIDTNKIKSIITKYNKWTPGEDKGEKVNVNITSVYIYDLK